MKVLTILCICALALFQTNEVVADVVVGAVSVSTNMGNLGSPYLPERAIDQSQLSVGYTSGVTDLADFIAANPTHGSANNWDGTWFATSITGFADFNLGSAYNVSTLFYWGIGTGGSGEQNIRGFTLFADDNAAFSSATNLGSFQIPLNSSPTTAIELDMISFAPTTAQYFRILVNSNWGSTRSSFSEVAFGASAIPEPTSAAILGLAMLGLACTRRRKK